MLESYLSFSTSEYNFIRKKGLYRGSQLKMRSQCGPHSSETGVLKKRGKFGHRNRHAHRKNIEKFGVMVPQDKSPPKAMARHGCFPGALSRSKALLTLRSRISSLRNGEKIHFCSLSHLAFGILLQQPSERNSLLGTGVLNHFFL